MSSAVEQEVLFTHQNGAATSGTWKIPFAVIKVYVEACGGGGGGGACNNDFQFYIDNAGAGGGGGGWGYKTFDVKYGGELVYEVGAGGEGKQGNMDPGVSGTGEAGTKSKIQYRFDNKDITKLECMGGAGGTKGLGGDGGIVLGADKYAYGQDGQAAQEGNQKLYGGNSYKNAKGGGGGGAGGLGRGSRTDAKVTVNYSFNECIEIAYTQGTGEAARGVYPYCAAYDNSLRSEDIKVLVCGGPSGSGINIGGTLKEAGDDATRREGGYYTIDGKHGKLYGGGGGGSASGHSNKKFNYPEQTEGWKVSYDKNDIPQEGILTGFYKKLFSGDVEEVELSNTIKNGRGGDGADGFVYFKYSYEIPIINVFEASEQKSPGGVPQDDVTIKWSTEHANDVKIINRSQGDALIIHLVHNLENKTTSITTSTTRTPYPDSNQLQGLNYASGSYRFKTLQRSVAGVCSPSSNTYRIIAKGPGGEAIRDINVNVYNDDIPSGPTTINDTPKLNPGQTAIYNIGSLTGVDMLCYVQATNCFFDVDSSNDWQSTGLVPNGKNLRIKVTALPFNTDENGLINFKTASLKFGRGFQQP